MKLNIMELCEKRVLVPQLPRAIVGLAFTIAMIMSPVMEIPWTNTGLFVDLLESSWKRLSGELDGSVCVHSRTQCP